MLTTVRHDLNGIKVWNYEVVGLCGRRPSFNYLSLTACKSGERVSQRDLELWESVVCPLLNDKSFKLGICTVVISPRENGDITCVP